jgi:hypothetical protein
VSGPFRLTSWVRSIVLAEVCRRSGPVAEVPAVEAWALDEVVTAEMVQAAVAWAEASSVQD